MIARIFGFLKSCIHLIKILIMFSVLMMILYWIADLKSTSWDWMNFIKPVLEFFLNIGALISDKSIDFSVCVFKFKFPIALVIMLILTFVADFINDTILEKFEDKCNEANRTIKQISENAYNDKLNKQNTDIQKKITKYQILVLTSLKKKFSHEELGYNIDEQNKIMNNFLMEKTNVSPSLFEGGFLYEFDSFEEIDKVLEIFFRLIKSNSPLDYVICVQIKDKNPEKENSQLQQLASLRFENKIAMLSDTAFRYKYNSAHRYGTSQLGLFQKGNGTIEAHEFVEIS